MHFKTNQKIMWSILELQELLEEDDSCVHFKSTKKHLALHPFHLKDLQRALNEILISMINTYDAELKGFLLSYKKPKLLSNLGEIFYDSCFIHVDIKADFYLFSPKVGCSLKGIVNKKGLDHIVLLVHKVFTVTIPKPDNEEEWLGNIVEIGQEVKCCVTYIDKSTKLPSICATLNTDYLQGCRLSETFNNIHNASTNIKINMNNIEEMANGSNITASEDSAIFNTETHVKIKIENPDPEACTEDNVESGNQSQINNDDMDACNNSNLNGYTESRKRKKREHSETDTSTYEPERKKKKKHSKKSRESDLESTHMTENEENEEKVINNTTNIVHRIKCTEEDQQKQQDNKKHKKNKKMVMVMSDSEPEDYVVKIKKEKPDPIIDKIIGKSPENSRSFSYEDINTQNLDEHMETNIYIKTEDSDKEKKKKSKKRQKTSRNTDSESELRIKSENKIINISSTNKHNDEDVKDGEQTKHTKHNTVESDMSSSFSDPDHVSRKPKKSRKSSKASPDLKSKYHVNIKEEEED